MHPVNTGHVGLIGGGLAMGTELSALGYRSPDDPDNFMQIAQTLLDKYSNGIISEELEGVGNLVVACKFRE